MPFEHEVIGVATRVTISSGKGEQRIRQCVLVHDDKDKNTMPDDPPTLAAMRTALARLSTWAQETYPDRTDWVMMPVERMFLFGERIDRQPDE